MINIFLGLLVSSSALANPGDLITTYNLTCIANSYGVFAALADKGNVEIRPGDAVNINLTSKISQNRGYTQTDALFFGTPPQAKYVVLYGSGEPVPMIIRAEINQSTMTSVSYSQNRSATRLGVTDMKDKVQDCFFKQISRVVE